MAHDNAADRPKSTVISTEAISTCIASGRETARQIADCFLLAAVASILSQPKGAEAIQADEDMVRGLAADHAYSIVGCEKKQERCEVTVRNPWSFYGRGIVVEDRKR